ncbi:MAG: RteC domain-containing protein [Flavobacteriia bacterium]|nr:RteC domain-containing protein [Flavobacteriia bacterium]
MENYFIQIHEDMNSRISALEIQIKKPNYYSNIITIIESCLEKLKLFLLSNPFQRIQDEINYFKHLKPTIVSKLIFYKRLLFIEIERPFGSTENKIEHLENELKLLTNFCKENSSFIHYIRSGKTEMDERYFVRAHAKNFQMHDSFTCEVDYSISTGHDYKLSIFLAYELLESHIQEQIDALKNPNTISAKFESSTSLSTCGSPNLNWTGTQTELVELIYGLNIQKVINNGNVKISDLAAFFEKSFNIKLNSATRTFSDIKRRKSERFKFLESMQINLGKYSDESLEN